MAPRKKQPRSRWGRPDVWFCPLRRSFVYSRNRKAAEIRKLRGAHHAVRDWYFKDFVFIQKASGARGTGAIRQSPEDAMKLGSRVDLELRHWAMKEDSKTLKQMHPYTKQVIAHLTERGWKPLASQERVAIPERGVAIGTAFDLLVQDEKKQQLVMVEIKTGGESSFEAWDNAQVLSPPLQFVPSTQETHAWLQLGLTAIAFHHSHRKKKKPPLLTDLAVIRTHAGGITHYERPSWLNAALEDMRKKIEKGARPPES